MSYFTQATFSGRVAVTHPARDRWFESIFLQRRVDGHRCDLVVNSDPGYLQRSRVHRSVAIIAW